MLSTLLQCILSEGAKCLDEAIASKISDYKNKDIYTYKFKCPECKAGWYLKERQTGHLCDCGAPIYFDFLSHEGEKVNYCSTHDTLFINKNYLFTPQSPCCSTKNNKKAFKVDLKRL